MSSYDAGKAEAVKWVKEHFSEGSVCLDVGACDGVWADLLGDYLYMQAVEVWAPNIEAHNLTAKYKAVHNVDARKVRYLGFDLVILGDVLEHMPVRDAQEVLAMALLGAKDVLVSLPFNYYQGAIYGNPYERHLQPDLNPEVIAERYPELEELFRPMPNYAYYHGRGRDVSK